MTKEQKCIVAMYKILDEITEKAKNHDTSLFRLFRSKGMGADMYQGLPLSAVSLMAYHRITPKPFLKRSGKRKRNRQKNLPQSKRIISRTAMLSFQSILETGLPKDLRFLMMKSEIFLSGLGMKNSSL